MGGRRLLAGLVTLVLAGCRNPPDVYDVPLHEAFERLAHNTLDDFRFHRQCGILVHISPEPIQDESVTWRVFSSDEEQVSFTAKLSQVSLPKLAPMFCLHTILLRAELMASKKCKI